VISDERFYNQRMSVEQHRKDAPASVRCGVLTISDTRTSSTDASGDAIARALTDAGHAVVSRHIVQDDPGAVRDWVHRAASDVAVIVTTGGTGITSRDSTYEAIVALLDKRLDGFGELFRMLSYEQIGSAAMLSRACAGTIGSTAVFALPGARRAVELAMEKLILPEIGHVVRELRRGFRAEQEPLGERARE
jgi:molybdenum cofactor biosynthesis protein B